jgi:hypothetical protein
MTARSQERFIYLVGASGPPIDTKHTPAFAAHTAPAAQRPPTIEQYANGWDTAVSETRRKRFAFSSQ